jgi:hypothetical protein
MPRPGKPATGKTSLLLRLRGAMNKNIKVKITQEKPNRAATVVFYTTHQADPTHDYPIVIGGGPIEGNRTLVKPHVFRVATAARYSVSIVPPTVILTETDQRSQFV